MHHKAYYRVVNGKVVHVEEGGEGQGRAAELHERTAMGKHRSGSYYLRASDAEDGRKIEEAARAKGIQVEKRRSGANHHGRVGAYDHYHVESAEHAQAIHEHLKGQGGSHAPSEGSERQPSRGEDPDAISQKARDAGIQAIVRGDHQDGAGKALHEKASIAHEKAAAAHLEAHERESKAGNAEKASEHYYNAAQHMRAQADHSSKHRTLRQHAEHQSNIANSLGKHAERHNLEETPASYGAHAEKHLMAIDAHARARDAHRSAGDYARLTGDTEKAETHARKADEHHERVLHHNKEMGKGHQEITRRRESAYAASEHANSGSGEYADRHEAAAKAHRHAAKVQNDSDIRALHLGNARDHEQRAEGLRPTQAKRDRVREHRAAVARGEDPARGEHPSARANRLSDEARAGGLAVHHRIAAEAHTDAAVVARAERRKTAAAVHRAHAKGHAEEAARIQREAAPNEPVTVREATPSRGHKIPPPPAQGAAEPTRRPITNPHEASRIANQDGTPEAHAAAAGVHQRAIRSKRAETEKINRSTGYGTRAPSPEDQSRRSRLNSEIREHELAVEHHRDRAREATSRAQQQANRQAHKAHLEASKAKVGNDPRALADIDLRIQALGDDE